MTLFLAHKLLTTWNRYYNERDSPRGPLWASFWRDIGPLLDAPDWPDRVRDAVGLGHVEANEWLAVLRYPLKTVGLAMRPTCLEADWQPWFFPTSPSAFNWGIAIDFAASPILAAEVIHLPTHISSDWIQKVGRTSSAAPPLDQVGHVRRKHWSSLQSRRGTVLSGIPEP